MFVKSLRRIFLSAIDLNCPSLDKKIARHTESKLYLLDAGAACSPLASQKALFGFLEIKLIGIFVGSAVACSRRSDSGERCEVKRSAKK